MHVDRIERVNALIRREIADAMYRTITDSEFDHAAVTVTHVVTARNLRTAKVLVSICGDAPKQKHLMGLIRHARADLQQAINRDLTLKYTPVLHFELDPSLQKGDRVLDVLSKLDLGNEDDTELDPSLFEVPDDDKDDSGA